MVPSLLSFRLSSPRPSNCEVNWIADAIDGRSGVSKRN